MTTSLAAPAAARRLRTYASFVRFEHTLFSLPLLLAGVFSVPGEPMSALRWTQIVLAAVGARTAAMSLNRLIDRRLDALNPRTRTRELPVGAMSVAEALALLGAGVGVYLLACAALGPLYLALSPIPLGVFAAYPYLKRFTPLCHFGVGAALALAPLAGFAAAHPALDSPGPAVALAVFALFWVSGFDVIYATLDEEFDRGHRIHSMVAWLGRARALGVSRVLHVLAFLALLAAGAGVLRAAGIPLAAWAAVPALVVGLGCGVLLGLEQRWAEDVNLAFFKVNVWVGFGVLAMVVVARAAGGAPWLAT
jgi:4-hydroxybenzoate polyprenyltransferase